MQRRQFLKYLLPLGLATAGLVAGVSFFRRSACTQLDDAQLLTRLKPFSDPELGKVMSLEAPTGDLDDLRVMCKENFDQAYRARIAADFSAGKTREVDGWLLSETEAITHRAVYLAGQP
jgi:hypothetical protein